LIHSFIDGWADLPEIVCVFYAFFSSEMLEYSEERNPWESMEDKLTLIRYISSFLCTDQIQNSIYYSTKNSQRRVIGITLLIA